MRLLIVVLLAVAGAWLLVDGVGALVSGEYLAPSMGSGTGPSEWVGLDPAGLPVRLAHVLAGVVALIAAFFIAAAWGSLAWTLGFLAAGLIAWDLPAGTVVGAAVALLLAAPTIRVEIRGR